MSVIKKEVWVLFSPVSAQIGPGALQGRAQAAVECRT